VLRRTGRERSHCTYHRSRQRAEGPAGRAVLAWQQLNGNVASAGAGCSVNRGSSKRRGKPRLQKPRSRCARGQKTDQRIWVTNPRNPQNRTRAVFLERIAASLREKEIRRLRILALWYFLNRVQRASMSSYTCPPRRASDAGQPYRHLRAFGISQNAFVVPALCRSRFEMSGMKRFFQLDFTAAAGHRKMPPA
jgi:hypothetical protein